MDHFHYRDGQLLAEEVPLAAIAAEHGTPTYVYSRATLERHWHAFDQALEGHPHLVCYAVKANSNLGVLNTLARLGSGFDIVSLGELERVLAAGGDPKKVLFSGVGKSEGELRRALALGIRCFNVESEPELRRLDRVAGEMGVRAPVSLRVNPDVDARTHPYISTGLKENKFGVGMEQAIEVYEQAARLPNLEVVGIDCHVGSQLTDVTPFVDALERLLNLLDTLAERGIRLKHLDMGGGLGVRYRDETPPEPMVQAAALRNLLEARGHQHLEIILEPGRAIAANAGVLLTRVEYLKHTPHKNFAIVDGAMNDLIRPALYGAWMAVLPVAPHNDLPLTVYDVVGPVCETADFLGKERELALREGDLLAVRSAGAYAFAMSSNYNSRPRAAEVMVDGATTHLVRRRESVAELFAGESLLPE